MPIWDSKRDVWVTADLVLTPWGLVSGIFWVPSGVSAVYAVQNVGLATAQASAVTDIACVRSRRQLILIR